MPEGIKDKVLNLFLMLFSYQFRLYDLRWSVLVGMMRLNYDLDRVDNLFCYLVVKLWEAIISKFEALKRN